MNTSKPLHYLGVRPAKFADRPPVIGSRVAVAAMLHRHPDQVKRHCQPVACHVQTRAPLYDADEAAMTLSKIRRRPDRARVA